jgi:hypothetical protein
METRSNRLWGSLSFWSGLLVMASVLIGWWDSTRYSASAVFPDLVVVNAGWGFTVAHWDASGITTSVDFERVPLGDVGEALAVVGLRWPVFLRNEGTVWQEEMMANYLLPDATGYDEPLSPLLMGAVFGVEGDWALYLPYWLVILVVMAAWAGGLTWRWRRIKAAKLPEGGEG